MKSIYNNLIGSFCLIAVLLLAIGCSEEYKYNTDYSFHDGVTLKVNLVDENNKLSVKLANKTHALTIAVTPEDVFIDSKAYIYELSDNSIASVALNGTLTLLKVGETTLTVKFRGNQEIATSCKLVVEPTLVSDVIIAEGSDIRVEEEKTLDLAQYVSVIPSSADNKTLLYTVKEGSTEYAEIVEGSIVKGLQKGTATIIVSATDGSEISKELTLQVTGKIPVSEIRLSNVAKLEGKTVAIGQTFNLGAYVTAYPTNASNQVLDYELVAGTGVISIDASGVVKTLAAGDVEIKISATDEFQEATPQAIKFKVSESQTLFERSLWFVDTSIVYANGNNYTADNTTGKPEHLIDGSNSTYLALTKPGKKYNAEITPADHVLFFVVDMNAEQEFNYFYYRHRNTTVNFQVYAISMFGSNDNENFTAIEEDIVLGGPGYAVELTKDLPLSKFRYIKVEFRDWNRNAGTNATIAEFNVGKK
ncbi:discoidin domain-containing protein [Bacteroides sp.]|uniref:discoidin domain-containing protein n=1 Tax=Bacteroides sp. TaxID=29523 RepID=UPI0025C22CAB|nr:discoidin domain-containing protein [Bacteroides sp.]